MTSTLEKTNIIACTAEKEMASDDGVYWWKEFRVRRISSDEYYRISIDAPYQEWLLEVRYLCRLPGSNRIVAKSAQGTLQGAIVNPVDPDAAWEPWALGKSKKAVIWEMLGDTSFLGATSLCAVHRKLVLTREVLTKAQNNEYQAEKVYKAACQSVDGFKRDEERLFNKRHGSKVGASFDKAKARTIKRLQPRLDQLRKHVNEAESHWRSAMEQVKLLTGNVKKLLGTSADNESW